MYSFSTFLGDLFFHASLNSDFMVPTIEETDFINVLGTEGTPGRVNWSHGVLSPVEGTNFSTVLVNLPDLLLPELDEPVAVEDVFFSVNTSSDLDSFCVSG